MVLFYDFFLASTTHNTLRLAYSESNLPINVTLSQLLLKETFVYLNESRVVANISDMRGSSLFVSFWNTGAIAGNFVSKIQCESSMCSPKVLIPTLIFSTEISLVTAPGPIDVAQQSKHLLEFTITSESRHSGISNCNITTETTKLPLWNSNNKKASITIPISILFH